MLPFFPDVIRPLLEALEPRVIVEVGSEHGRTTARLLELARTLGAVVHAVDPAPRFDPVAWRAEHGDRFVMHRARSLDALAGLERFDAVLIDGDHNWYTVLGELTLLARRARELALPFPLVLLHDVGWPYGRRDLYYDPDAIPAEHRRPCARKGISLTHKRLADEGGMNPTYCHALDEGGPRNGVLTAVEDFLAEAKEPIELVRIPALFGLGILLSAELAARKPAVAARARAWAVPEIVRFLERLEIARLATLT
jgi:hypothetical protein